MIIRNSNDLKRALSKVVRDSAKDVADSMVEEVQEEIDKSVYGAGVPNVYERTGQLRDSFGKLNESVFTTGSRTELGHDFDKIKPMSPNQHVSIYTGKPFVKELPSAIHSGAGNALGTGFWTHPRPYFDNVVDRLDSGLFDRMAMNSLSKYGGKIERK